jgi:hypothetical protein
MRKGKGNTMYLVSLCREHLVAWPAVALFRQVAQDQQLLPRKQGLLFAAKHAKEKKRRRLVLNRAKFPLFLFCPEPVSANDRVHRNSKGECGVFVYMKRHAVVSISALPLLADLYRPNNIAALLTSALFPCGLGCRGGAPGPVNNASSLL